MSGENYSAQNQKLGKNGAGKPAQGGGCCSWILKMLL